MTKENDTEKLEKEVVAKLEEYRSWSDNLTKDEIQSLDERKPSKRKSYTETSPVPIKKKKVGPPQPKNAVQTLNEYKAGHYRDNGMKSDILIHIIQVWSMLSLVSQGQVMPPALRWQSLSMGLSTEGSEGE